MYKLTAALIWMQFGPPCLISSMFALPTRLTEFKKKYLTESHTRLCPILLTSYLKITTIARGSLWARYMALKIIERLQLLNLLSNPTP